MVKLLFGPVSILLGVLTIVLSRRVRPRPDSAAIPNSATIPLIVAAFIGGLITGWIAIGEGEIIAALLMLFYGVDVATCIGLGVILLAVNSLFLTAIHMSFLGPFPWDIAMFVGFGCVFGARLAPWLSHRSNPIVLKTVFAAIAIADGLLFMIQYFIVSRAM